VVCVQLGRNTLSRMHHWASVLSCLTGHVFNRQLVSPLSSQWGHHCTVQQSQQRDSFA
jgi:hypothetical protein